jgi:hypothetical protein
LKHPINIMWVLILSEAFEYNKFKKVIIGSK